MDWIIDLPRRTRGEDTEKWSGKRKAADNADALSTNKQEGYPNENPEQPGLMTSKETVGLPFPKVKPVSHLAIPSSP